MIQRLKSELGQASVMIGMMLLTFILFFAFVINTGMLVNAKINLQNAADMAAYAGASVQARQLNDISYLNYEMRRQYKKFLFRYYVMGNMAQKTHPGNPGAPTSGARNWSPDGTQRYDVPAVCVAFNNRDNYCQLDKLAGIRIPKASRLDSTQNVLREQLEKIEQLRQNQCELIGVTNKQIAAYWLWNTDPTLQSIESFFATLASTASAEQQKLLSEQLAVFRGMVRGLGLIPREMILRRRIETLQEYINTEGENSVTIGKVNKMKAGEDPAARERTIQAFLSAYQTLGPSTFDDDEEIVMDELLPLGANGASLLGLQDIRVDFDTYAVDFELQDRTGSSTEPKDCAPYLIPYNAKNLPVGVVKNREILTYYAVRLKAKAKVMFSPWGDLTLKAYSAAKPFGSRIGPDLEPDAFLRAASYRLCTDINSEAGGGSYNQNHGGAVECMERIPNLPVARDDGTGTGQGWDTNDVIHAMYQKFGGGGGGSLPAVIRHEDMERAYQAAMAPNPWEEGKYNILGDFGDTDPFVDFFDDETHVYPFWAPIVSPEKMAGNDIEDQINDMISQLTLPPSANESSAGAKKYTIPPEFKEGLKAGLSQYFNLLTTGQGESDQAGAGEGFNIVRLVDPFFTRPEGTGASPAPINLPPRYLASDPATVKSSWNGVKDGNFSRVGRTGYSVKFVSFRSLLSGSEGGQSWSNLNSIPADQETTQDLPLLQH